MASILTAVPRALGRAAKGAAYGFVNSARRAGHGMTLIPQYLAGLLWILSQNFLDLARTAYAGNSACYAVLRALSSAVAEPPLIAYALVDGAHGDRLPYDHPLSALIRQPNPFMTGYEMWELMTLQEGLAGRTCWWKERNNDGSIRALWPLRPDRVGPIYDTATVISGWSYLVPGTTQYVPLPARDVLMSNLPDPAGESGGMVEGLGWVQVLASEVGADNEATRYVGALLANGAQPGMILTVKQSINDQATVDAIKYAAKREFGGANRGSPAVLDSDTTITETGFSMKDLEFPALRDVSESRIAAASGMPAALVGLHVGLKTGTNDATIVAQREYFAETTCENYWRRHEMAYTRDVASEFGVYDCAFDRKQVKALALQTAAMHDKLTDGFKNGAVDYNEYREQVLGLPAIPGAAGKRRVLPRGAIEIDENGDVVEQAGAPVQEALPGQAKPPLAPLPAARKTARITVHGKPDPEHVQHTANAVEAWGQAEEQRLWEATA